MRKRERRGKEKSLDSAGWWRNGYREENMKEERKITCLEGVKGVDREREER